MASEDADTSPEATPRPARSRALRVLIALALLALIGVGAWTLALLLNGGEAWWARVLALYPSQSVLEPSVTIFAAYAVEAGVLIHRLARRGVITFADAVPFYAKLVLPLLTLLPMGCLFVHKADEVSFWDFLFLGAG